MKRHSGIGIIRNPGDGRSHTGSTYFQRRAQPHYNPSAPARLANVTRVPSETSSETTKSETPKRPETKATTAGANAIAVLTNQPNKVPTRIHRNELPVVAKTQYPRVKSTEFDRYIENISTLFEQYEANSKAGYQIAADELDRYEAAVEDAEKVLEAASHTYSMDSTTMAERLRTLDGTRSEFGLESISEYGGGLDDASGPQLPGIEDIPTIFFEDKFDLCDPATFDIVTQVVLGPQKAQSELFAPERSQETSARMQETLSGYMDTVEGYLTREISRRSPAFFAALSTLEDLHAETDRCIGKIHVLRSDLRKTTHAQCSPGLELVRLRRRRDNLATVLEDIELLSGVRHVQPTIDELIGSGDCIGALNLIVEAQEMIEPAQRRARERGRTKKSRQEIKAGVAETKAFRVLSGRLTRALGAVSQFAERELAATLLRDMREFVDDGLTNGQLGVLDREQVDIYQVNLGMQLTPLILGLARIGGISGALKIYGDHLMAETAELIEGLYPSSFPRSLGHATFNDATQQRSLNAAVRALTFDQFRSLLGQQQELLLLIITHIGMVRRAIIEVIDDNKPGEAGSTPISPAFMASREPTPSETGSPASLAKHYEVAKSEVQRSLNETFDSFMDVAHVRCAKLLNHRSEQNARLSLAGFYSLYASISQFVVQYEQLCGKMCFGLRGTLTAQAKAFLSNFHNEKSRQIHILIENEQWVQAEVPIDFQNLVNQVVEAAGQQTSTAPSSPLMLGTAGTPGINTPASGPLALVGGNTGSNSQTKETPTAAAPKAFEGVHVQMALTSKIDSDAASVRSVDTAGIGLMHIGMEAFHVVGCSLVLVKSVVEYLQCAVNIPVLATDVLQRLVEVFKAFNSRTCQVVLGAGAMRSAGLKNISAKHLALASESLGMCMELLPYVKECLRHVMAAAQEGLLGQLDRTSSDFANHQHELHRKLVAIMTDRADYHCRMLGTTRWDSTAPVPVPAIDGLAKEVRKLHRVLKRYLPPAPLKWVFGQIFSMYEEKLTAQYRKLRITTGEGKRQLMVNSQYLLKKFRALDPAVEMGLEVAVNNIDLVRPYQPQPASASASPETEGY